MTRYLVFRRRWLEVSELSSIHHRHCGQWCPVHSQSHTVTQSVQIHNS